VKRALRVVGRLALAASGIGLLAFAGLWLTTDVERARFAHPDDALTVTDRHGTALRRYRPDGEDRRWVGLIEVSPHLIDAVLAVEDDRFREHPGVDARATLRALLSFALPGRRLSGGSTITQQTVKLVYGRPHGLWSKPREMVRALMLERDRGKDWILEQYLNRLPYSDRVVGVARASELYFGEPVGALSVGQAALLAGIPQAPTALDPLRHRQAALRRRRVVLRRMLDTGRIDAATHRAALAEPVVIARRPMRPWRAPRAAELALEGYRAGALDASGGRLPTSLDLPLTTETERVLRGALFEHEGRGATNAAAVVVSNHDGRVLAYVGAARRGSDAEGGWLDLARARRQPGSTLKPFVYELLFERGGTPATVLEDVHRPMVGRGGTLFVARDYDGRERGPVRARDALSASLNLAALDAARRVGAERIVARLRALGMTELDDASEYGAAIVLGGADVSVVELAEAYTALARGGTHTPLTMRPGDGAPVEGTPVMEAVHAALVTDVLRDGDARRAAFGDDLRSIVASPFALKTGTSSGWRDAWTAAYTDDVTVVVWLGDPGTQPMRGLSGFRGAARPAARILAAATRRLRELGVEPPARTPPTLARAIVCGHTGRLAGARCTHATPERFAPGTAPTRVCDAHRADGSVELDARYARWLRDHHPAGFALATGAPADGAPRVAYPDDGSRLLVRPGGEVPLRATVRGRTVAARWEVDGAPLDGQGWRGAEGEHVLVAVVGDRRSDPVHVELRAAR